MHRCYARICVHLTYAHTLCYRVGLEGVDVDTIFSLPGNCTHIQPGHPEFNFAMTHLRPMLTLHTAIAKLFDQ